MECYFMEKLPTGTERIQLEQEMPPGIERRLVLRLLAHWRSFGGDQNFPTISDIDIAAIPDIWPHSFLLEFDEAEGGYVFRALGEEIVELSSLSLVGRRDMDAPTDALPGMALVYLNEAIEKAVPISRGGEFINPEGKKVLYRSVLLPLSSDGKTINGILGAANCREVVDH